MRAKKPSGGGCLG
ncbi:hypothetical protein R3I94_001244 [Phoxinus phoxinus]